MCQHHSLWIVLQLSLSNTSRGGHNQGQSVPRNGMAFIKLPVLTYRRVKTWGLKIALTTLQLPPLLTVIQQSYWTSLPPVQIHSVLNWILSNHIDFTHRTEVSGLDFKDLSNYTNITISLSNTQYWRWGNCVPSTLLCEEIHNDVDFILFFKINLFLISPPTNKYPGIK